MITALVHTIRYDDRTSDRSDRDMRGLSRSVLDLKSIAANFTAELFDNAVIRHRLTREIGVCVHWAERYVWR